jgi:hypothetical protein
LIHQSIFLPQQLPGPAQLAAWPGDEPQQAVSPIPGMVFFTGPDADAWADTNFSRFWLLQKPQIGGSLFPNRMISLILLQSLQRYSKIGMGFPFTDFVCFGCLKNFYP